MRPIVVVGAGGHAASVIDAARSAGMTVAGLLDGKLPAGEERLGIAVIGSDEKLQDGVFVASHLFHLGFTAPAAKRRFIESGPQGVVWHTVRHAASVISETAAIGEGTFVGAASVVNANARIGDHVVVNSGAVVEHDCTVGDFAHVSPNATVLGYASIGVGVQIGAGAVVLPGITVADGVVIGAGAVVSEDIPDAGVTVAGVPARRI